MLAIGFMLGFLTCFVFETILGARRHRSTMEMVHRALSAKPATGSDVPASLLR